MEDVIAETSLLGVFASGKELDIKVRIGQPYCASNASCVCWIEVCGLIPKPRSIFGVDTFQALMLALHHIRFTLQLFIDDGGLLYMLDGDERHKIDIDFLFPAPYVI